ncbi:DUF6559 family protein [Veronia pacifica]|uniref:Uncharacterized protein n=1 Tax=Veronia pacifica TaxID=1080227 RepID=A0A1C3EMT3_9GAMM|nr:DUF6559 family protein [Veronia pacifica]ODA34541.1 hypothetical protein A8L45_06110 [Veronia pacifica]
MFQRFFKNRKIKKYAKDLPYDLKRYYGSQQYYSKKQVDGSAQRRRIKNDTASESVYLYAMFCSPDDFNAIHHDSLDEGYDYHSLRSEIADILFTGHSDFTFTSLLMASSDSSPGFNDKSYSGGNNDGYGGDIGGFGGGSDGGGGGGGGGGE